MFSDIFSKVLAYSKLKNFLPGFSSIALNFELDSTSNKYFSFFKALTSLFGGINPSLARLITGLSKCFHSIVP